MKKSSYFGLIFALSMACCLLSIGSLFSQAPQGLNYQAVAPDNGGTILQDQPISLRFTITEENGGTVLYQEIQNTISIEFGLITLSVGKGFPG